MAMQKHKNLKWIIPMLLMIIAFGLGMSVPRSGTSLEGAVRGNFTPASNLSCVFDNCDLMDEVKSLHDEIGYSTWTLEAGVNRVMSMLTLIDHNMGYSTWTLDALAYQIATYCH